MTWKSARSGVNRSGGPVVFPSSDRLEEPTMKRTIAVVATILIALLAAACGRPASGPAASGTTASTAAASGVAAPGASAATGPLSSPAPPLSSPASPVVGLGTAPVTHFAGRVPGGDLTAAIVVAGTRVVAYVCDCRSTDAWLSGEVGADGQAKLLAAKSTVAVRIDNVQKQAVGTLTWRGQALQIALQAVDPGYGLFRAAQGRLSGGWIRLPGKPAGTSCGLVKVDDRVTAAGPFTGTGPVDVPGYGTLTPQRVDG
jgi:hypothetical protein